jgi:hypothetical protein
MLTLVLIPCKDACTTEVHSEITSGDEAQQHHDMENDLCSPFCSCSCCSTLILGVPLLQVNSLQYSRLFTFQRFDSFHVAEMFTDHWQPPKFFFFSVSY